MEPSSKWFDLAVFQEALRLSLNQRAASMSDDFFQAKEAIMDRSSIETTESRLSKNGATAFFKCIVQAYAVKIFRAKTAACGPLAQLLDWFITNVSHAQRRAIYDVLLREREYDASKLSVIALSTKGGMKSKLVKEAQNPRAAILLGLLSLSDITGSAIDAVIRLLQGVMCEESDGRGDDPLSSTSTMEDSFTPHIMAEVLSSRQLVSLFFDPMTVTSLSPGVLDAAGMKEIRVNRKSKVIWSDGRSDEVQSGKLGPRVRVDQLLLTALNTCKSEDAFATVATNLTRLYKDPRIFKKRQLHRILETWISLEDTPTLSVFFNELTTGPSNNETLLLDTVEFFFELPVQYGTSTLLSFDDICRLAASCAETVTSDKSSDFLRTCCASITHSDIKVEKQRKWVCERLHLLSFFFSDEARFVRTSAISDGFVTSLFDMFLSIHDDLSSEKEDLPFAVLSDFKAISEGCCRKAAFSVFSCLLKASRSKYDTFVQLSDAFCSTGMLDRWARGVNSEDALTLLKFCQMMESKNTEWLSTAMCFLLQSDAGRTAVCNASTEDIDWTEVCKRLLRTTTSGGALSDDIALSVIRLACVLGQEDRQYLMIAMMSDIDKILCVDIPEEDFSAFVNVLSDGLANILNDMITAVCNAAVKRASLANVRFFDHLTRYFADARETEGNGLRDTLFSQLSELFDLLQENDEGEANENLEKLVRFLIDGTSAAHDTHEDQLPRETHPLIPAFTSATFPNGRSIQSETASSADLRRIVQILKQSDLSLDSGHVRNAILQTSEAVCRGKEENEDISISSSLILTDTTEENITMIQEAVADGNPVLLIGSTGVGKTATLTEVCGRMEVEFVRINMSSNLTPEDFLARASVNHQGEIVQQLQPFAKSYQNGAWVLLDEMNLAEEASLKVIVDAIESEEISICDQSSAASSTITIRKHPEFRLFATQNPWQAGKRERISDAFLSQFSIMHFKELPDHEWRQIVEEKISRGSDGGDPARIQKLAKQMTKFHCDLRAELNAKCSEKGSYATITNRELLMWTDMILAEKALVRADEKMGDYAWSIYGNRFRGDGRQLVRDSIDHHHLPLNSTGLQLESLMETFSVIEGPCHKNDVIPVNDFWKTHFSCMPSLSEDEMFAFDFCADAHRTVLKMILNPQFMKTFGIYTTFSESWLANWVTDALKESVLGRKTLRELGQLGASVYCSRFRNEEARNAVLDAFVQTFGISPTDVQTTVKATVPEMPIALSNRTCESLYAMIEAIRSELSVLIEGNAGSGKTCLGKVIAFLLGNQYEHVTLTQDSEPAAMLGEYLPGESTGTEYFVEWTDGPLTRAFIEGNVCIVDNIGHAEPVLQERINPVLESPKVLCLTERGDTKPLCCRVLADGTVSEEPGPARGFQFIATYTPKGAATRGHDSSSKDLTAALFNRFFIIHIDDPAEMPDEGFCHTLESMLRCCLSSQRYQTSVNMFCTYCLRIRAFLSEECQISTSFRDFVTLVDIATILMDQFPDLDVQDALHSALMATFVSRMNDPCARDALCSQMECPGDILDGLGLLDDFTICSDLVLTTSRKRHAQAVLLGILASKPVLLEGKPAVGKTSLVMGLKGFGGPPANRVRILSNSDTTTIQDYFGAWMPASDGFTFQKGILVQAMEKGEWFIADEFNLAPVAVTAALMPFLEGNRTVQVPGSNIRVNVHPAFRFFATQNPSHGGRDGRKLLPITIRNRFLLVEVEDFPQDEFAEIIYKRFQNSESNDLVNEEDADALAEFYFLAGESLHLTMRDMIKILRRCKLLKNEGQQSVTWAEVTMSLLGPQMATEDDMTKLLQFIESSFGVVGSLKAAACEAKSIKQESDGVRFSQGHLHVHFPGFELDNSPLWRKSVTGKGPPAVFQHRLIDLAFALKANEPVLLYGETAFKTELIKTWMELSGMANSVQRVHLTSQTEATDLIGQVQLISFVEVVQRLATISESFLSQLTHNMNRHSQSAQMSLKITYFQRLQQRLRKNVILLIEEFQRKNTAEEGRSGLAHTAFANPAEAISQGEEISVENDSEDDYNAFEFESSADSNEMKSQNEEVSCEGESDNDDDYDAFGFDDSVEDSIDNERTADVPDWGSAEQSARFDESGNGDAVFQDLSGHAENALFMRENKQLTDIDDVTGKILDLLLDITRDSISVAEKRMVQHLKQLRMLMRTSDARNSHPCFVFKDGPFLRAITMKHAFVMEDYDLCPQSVTERLNSALEVDPTFSIPEDISFSNSPVADIGIPREGYCFIATVHLDSVSSKRPPLSAPTLSRLTQIRCPVYSTSDVMAIAEEKLHHELANEEKESIPYLMEQINGVRTSVIGIDPEHPSEDFRRILRWISFITNHPRALSLEKRCMLGAKFLYLAGYPMDIQDSVLRNCFPDDFRALKTNLAILVPENPFRFQEAETSGCRTILLKWFGLSLEMRTKTTESSRGLETPELFLCPTASVCENIARIFASVCTSAPLLLEGAPGIGKQS